MPIVTIGCGFCSYTCGLSFVFHSKEWILDFGYAYHMGPNKDLFFNFEELDFGTVFISNGHVYDILGIGKIRFCMINPLLICLMFGISRRA